MSTYKLLLNATSSVISQAHISSLELPKNYPSKHRKYVCTYAWFLGSFIWVITTLGITNFSWSFKVNAFNATGSTVERWPFQAFVFANFCQYLWWFLRITPLCIAMSGQNMKIICKLYWRNLPLHWTVILSLTIFHKYLHNTPYDVSKFRINWKKEESNLNESTLIWAKNVRGFLINDRGINCWYY